MATTAIPAQAKSERSSSKRRFNERLLSPLMLAPSVIALIVFIYGFIGMTFWISISNWRKAGPMDLSIVDPWWGVYDRLFNDRRFQIGLRNTIVFTILFLLLAVAVGLLLAILLDRNLFGGSVFRNIFLFPYALSFIVTGVSWRWIFNPDSGINLLFDHLGLNWVLGKMGIGQFHPGWLTNPAVWGDLPMPDWIKAQIGFPAAMLPVIIAAVWQLSGFAMAMYLAGLGTISNEVREAAQLDGASNWRMYKDIIIPLLKPITVSTLIILGHVSLKIFDLIFAMSGTGPGFSTDVPGIYMFEQTFKATRYNLGAAASVVMLIMVSLVIVPYLARTMKEL